jgi:hypothetical protein
MDALTYTLKTLPDAGKRLEGGLGLRISRGNGFAVLGASRAGVPPSVKEMEILKDCIVEIWRPSQIWRGRVTSRRRVVDGCLFEDFIWRLYWPLEDLELVHETAVQERLF